MATNFKIEKEADIEAAGSETRQTNFFCPVIKDKCRGDCINFVEASVYKSESSKLFHVIVAYCNSPLTAPVNN